MSENAPDAAAMAAARSALLEARTLAEQLAALLAGIWAGGKRSGKPPANGPTVEDVQEILVTNLWAPPDVDGPSPPDTYVRQEFLARLEAVRPVAPGGSYSFGIEGDVQTVSHLLDGGHVSGLPHSPTLYVIERAGDVTPTRLSLPDVADACRRATRAPGAAADVRHPFAPVVRAWIDRQPVKPFRPVNRASLPRIHRTTNDDSQLLKSASLPAWLDDDPSIDPAQLVLPGLAAPVSRSPNWLLDLYDQAGGESLAQGRGAPWDLRLFVAALLHLHIDDRDGDWHRLPLPLADVIKWLHPDGWANRRRDWEKLPAALRAMSGLYIPMPGVGSMVLAFASVIPRKPHHPGVEFTIRLPRSAAAGARIDWPRLCQYGKDSAALYRAYLSVCSVLDNSAHKGQPITRQIAAPVIGPDGKRKRRKGGAIVRDSETLIDNPASRFVQLVTDADAARFIGFDPTHHQRRTDARRALERLAADGVIELEPAGRGQFRIFGPRKPDKP